MPFFQLALPLLFGMNASASPRSITGDDGKYWLASSVIYHLEYRRFGESWKAVETHDAYLSDLGANRLLITTQFSQPDPPELAKLLPAWRDRDVFPIGFHEGELAPFVPPSFVRGGNPPEPIDSLWSDPVFRFLGKEQLPPSKLKGAFIDLFQTKEADPILFARSFLPFDSKRQEELSQNNLNLLGLHLDRREQLWAFQFSIPGTPLIQDGDEVGLPNSGLVWDLSAQNKPLLAFVKTLIALRRTRVSLALGDYEPVKADDDAKVFVFSRNYRFEHTLAFFNGSDEVQDCHVSAALFGDHPPVDLIGNAQSGTRGATVSLSLAPHGFAILGS